MLKVCSLFSGAGGLDWGFHTNSNFEIVFANDFMKEACQTYRHNFNNPSYLHEGDIKQLFNKIPQHDVLIGGFPCQAFSMAGLRRGFDDERGLEVYSFAKVLDEKSPSYFIAENVQGILSHDDGKTLVTILQLFKDLGYSVEYRLFDMSNFGIPQRRKRVIFFGSKNGAKFLNNIKEVPKTEDLFLKNVLKTVPYTFGEFNHNLHTATSAKQHWFKVLVEGENLKDLTEDEILIRENMLGLDHKTKPKSLTGYRRLEGNKISPTMMFGNTCFIAGTQVLCDNEFKNIEEINIGDKVLTHNNRFKPVTHVMENLTNRIIEVKINSTPLITCTLEHPFLTIEGWKNAGRLNENDFVAMAKIDKEQTVIWDGVTKHTSNPLIQRVIKTLPVESKNFWTFIGRWLADGFVFNSIRKGRKTGTFGRVYLCDSIDKQNEIECLLKSIGLNFNKKIINNTVKYVMTSKELVKFLKDFGSSCSNKNIPTKYLNLRADLMQSLLVGYLSGDGHQPRNGVWEFVTVSQRLFLGLHSICNKLGYRITCKEKEPGEWNIEGRSGVTLKTWSGRIYLDPIKKDFKDVDGIRFYKVSSVLIKEFETKVFNISVQDDETYTANGVVVHNCLPIHPTEDRSISVREAATIQTFPADFVFCGGIASQYKQVGNAVPPAFSILLAKQLSEL